MKSTLPAKEVQPGMVVWEHGYKWLVRENRFDPYGNSGHQPRHILICDAVGNDRDPPVGYVNNMTLGYPPEVPVTLADE